MSPPPRPGIYTDIIDPTDGMSFGRNRTVEIPNRLMTPEELREWVQVQVSIISEEFVGQPVGDYRLPILESRVQEVVQQLQASTGQQFTVEMGEIDPAHPDTVNIHIEMQSPFPLVDNRWTNDNGDSFQRDSWTETPYIQPTWRAEDVRPWRHIDRSSPLPPLSHFLDETWRQEVLGEFHQQVESGNPPSPHVQVWDSPEVAAQQAAYRFRNTSGTKWMGVARTKKQIKMELQGMQLGFGAPSLAPNWTLMVSRTAWNKWSKEHDDNRRTAEEVESLDREYRFSKAGRDDHQTRWDFV